VPDVVVCKTLFGLGLVVAGMDRAVEKEERERERYKYIYV